MSKHSNTPELRFPEFKDEWKDNELGKLLSIISGHSPSYYSEGSEYPLYKVNDLNNNSKFQNYSDLYVEKKHTPLNKKVIIFPKRGAAILLNKIRIINTPGYIDTNLMGLEFNDVNDTEFYYYAILREGLYRIADTSTIPQINNKHISPYKIYSPSYTEKNKLGNFFSKLDQQIELEEKKLELLEQQKRGYMQKIFSQELRFKDDNGNKYPNWETKKLSSIATITRGLTYKPSDIRQNGVRVLRSSNILNDKFHIYKDDVFVDKNIVKIPLASEDDILITAANGSPKLVGKHALIKDLKQDSVAGGFMYLLKSEYAKFIQIWMNSKEYKKIITKVQGGNGSIGNLSRKDLENGIITIPCLEEQKKIGIFFSEIDKCSETLEQKIKILKQRKKGLLQKMFI